MELRVIDFGRVSALRSQSLWHAIANGVSEGSPPTLSFMVPESPYVSIGLHVDIAAVDIGVCERANLPVFRRMVGGGPVYLDDNQLFFQITVPATKVPAMRDRTVRHLLAPAVEAFRSVGIEAELDATNEIVVGDQKICGHAAGQIGNAVIVVGNLITGFDHDAAAAIASTPSRPTAEIFRQMLERYVTPVDADPRAFTEAATAAYTSSLQLIHRDSRATGPGRFVSPLAGEMRGAKRRSREGEHRAKDALSSLSEYELNKLTELDRKLADPEFVRGEPRASQPPWKVKVKSGVWVYGTSDGDSAAAIGVVDNVIESVMVDGPGDSHGLLKHALIGNRVDGAASRVPPSGKEARVLVDLVDIIE